MKLVLVNSVQYVPVCIIEKHLLIGTNKINTRITKLNDRLVINTYYYMMCVAHLYEIWDSMSCTLFLYFCYFFFVFLYDSDILPII
jgi:hypothetical protein